MAANTVPVKMYWNAENMRSTSKDEELVSKLNGALKRHDERFFLNEIVICANEDAIDARRRRNIATPDCPVTYIKPPERILKCDGCKEDFRPSFVADRRLLEVFLCHANGHPGAIMLLVASDSFSWAIRDLVRDGYTILSAVKHRTSAVATASSVYWLWEGMQQEDAPFQFPSRTLL